MKKPRIVDRIYPSIRTQTIRPARSPKISIDATVSIHTGRAIVECRLLNDYSWELTPTEADKLAAALIRAAECCRAKERAARWGAR